MTQERMNDLLELIQASGWRLTNPESMYLVQNGSGIHWKLEQISTGKEMELEFQIFGQLGKPSESLSDIFYCNVKGTTNSMYFARRNSEKWKHGLQEFMKVFRQP